MPIEFPLRIAVWLLRLSRSRLESLIVNTASYCSKASAFGPNFRLRPNCSHLDGTIHSRALLRLRYDTRCYFSVRSIADISQLNLPHGTGTARLTCGAESTKLSGVRPSVRPSVTLSHLGPPHAAAAGLLPWARWAGDVDRSLHGRRSAASASSVTL